MVAALVMVLGGLICMVTSFRISLHWPSRLVVTSSVRVTVPVLISAALGWYTGVIVDVLSGKKVPVPPIHLKL